MKNRLPVAAALLGFSAVASADGEVIFDVAGNTHDQSGAFARGSDGRLYVHAGASPLGPTGESQIYMMALDANGAPLADFGTAGKIAGAPGGSIAVRPDGSIIAGGGRVVTYDAAGAQVGWYYACGIFAPCYYGDIDRMRVYANTFLPLADNRVYAGGGHRFRLTSDRWTLVRVNVDGTKDTAFAGNADGWVEKPGGLSSELAKLRQLSTTQMVGLGWNRITGEMTLSRFDLGGATDFTFGTNGVLDIGTSTALPVASAAYQVPLVIDQSQRILAPGPTSYVARRLSDGSLDSSYIVAAPNPQIRYLAIAIDSVDRVLVFGQRAQGGAYVARLLPNGGLDPSFGIDGEVTYTSQTPGTADLQLSDGLVDAANRPVLYFNVVAAGAPVQIDVYGALAPRDLGLARLTTGGALDVSFGAGVADADAYPDVITFTSNMAPNGTANFASDPVTITGINVPTSVRINNLLIPSSNSYSIGCNGTFVQIPGIINPGQTICVRHSVPSTPGAGVTTILDIGNRQATYTTTATAVAADVAPDAFMFTNLTGVAVNSQVTSAPIIVSGITGNAPIAINFGEYSIGCDPIYFRSSSGTITNGQTVCVRVTASSNFSTAVTATLGIGGISGAFTATTEAADTTPDPFQLNAVGAVSQSEYVNSSTITMTGINSPAPISVSGPASEYSIGCGAGAFTSQVGTIINGQTVCVRHVSAAAPGSTVTSTLIVGGVSASFTSTTSSAASGGAGGGGSLNARDLSLLALMLAWLHLWSAVARRRAKTQASSTGTR